MSSFSFFFKIHDATPLVFEPGFGIVYLSPISLLGIYHCFDRCFIRSSQFHGLGDCPALFHFKPRVGVFSANGAKSVILNNLEKSLNK